mmetsp:Transcript_5791/g.9752  ORF Transcript_5791/g.9752 Transcript_5791/m.9752 type:complete len:314 (+) Transcript_5791:97-1038(+)
MSNIATTTYRQEVANFLFTCDQKLSSSSRRSSLTSWIGDTARTVTLRSVAAAAAGDIPNNLGAHDIGVKTLVPNRADYVCMTCGTFLLPQTKSNQNHTATSLTELATNPTITATTTNCKISLQSMKRGRSRRRRASRCRAKELHNSSLLMKRAGSTNNPQVRINVMAQKELLKLVDSYRLGDGKSKQCIVVECKFCGSKRKRKGIEVCVKTTRRKTDQSDAKATCSTTKSKNEKKTQTHAQSRMKMNTVGTQIRDNTDFISLASFGKSKQQATKKRPMSNDAPLLQVGKKKKKKQEPKGKKSSLMDFLSSLND